MQRRRRRLEVLAIVALTSIMLVLIERHTPGVNGPFYGMITWRRYPAAQVYGLMLMCAAPTIVAMLLAPRFRCTPALLILPMVGAFAGKLVFAHVRSPPHHPLDFISAAVQHPLAVSYYTDALALSNFPGWLADFPRIMPMLNLHSQTKPPGMILYYSAFIQALGHSDRTAMIAGVCLGAIATLSIPACYMFLKVLLKRRRLALMGACFLSLCPGYVLFFPAADPAFTILSCLIGAAWIAALQRNSVSWAAGCGAMASVMLIVSFNLLMFGPFLAAYALIVSPASLKQTLRTASIALLVCVALCAMIWLITGYNPVTTFISAWRNQQALLAQHPGDRPYPATAWNDLLDLALGTGWISFLLAGFGVAAVMRRGSGEARFRIVMLCVALPLFVAITAQLAAETARTWNFMFPVVMAPLAIALARYRLRHRIVVLVCLALLLASVCRNMSVFM